MYRYLPIQDIYAREILDSRGNPALEAEVLAGGEIVGRASVPSGALTGTYEATELRDREVRYLGKGVERAVENVNNQLAQAVIGMNVFDQAALDKMLVKTDGSRDKKNLGANTLLGVSMAAAHTAALALKIPLYRYLGGTNPKEMPIPMMTILDGGIHADNTLDIQEFMIVPGKSKNFRERLRICTEVYQNLKGILTESGFSVRTGGEGGFAPDLPDAKEALKLIEDAAKRAGYQMGRDIFIALDAAASRLYNKDSRKYEFSGESKMKGQRITRDTEELIEYYEELAGSFPICAIEDALDEDDWDGWRTITERLGEKIQLAGDALFSTTVQRLKKGIQEGVANTVVIKINQAGTLSEVFEVIETAKKAGYQIIISHRYGETEDTTIADIAVAFHAGYIKAGAPCGTERIAKYNQLLRIEEELGI